MGTGTPKTDDDRRRLDDLLGEMEIAVKDTIILEENSDDATLDLLIELTVSSIANETPLFASPLEEPVFYRRYFLPWVREGIEELRKIKQADGLSEGEG